MSLQQTRNFATRKMRNIAKTVGSGSYENVIQDAIRSDNSNYDNINIVKPRDDRYNITQVNIQTLIREINEFIDIVNNKFIKTDANIKKIDTTFADINKSSKKSDYNKINYNEDVKNEIFNGVYISHIPVNPLIPVPRHRPNYPITHDLYRLFTPVLDKYIAEYNTIILGYIHQIFLIKEISDQTNKLIEKDAELKEKDAELKTKNAEIAALKIQSFNNTGNKQALQRLTTERDKLIQEQEQEIAKLKNENEKLLIKLPNVVQNNLSNIDPIIAATTSAIVSSIETNPIANIPINVDPDIVKLIYFLAYNRALQLQKPEQAPKQVNLTKLEQTIKNIQSNHSSSVKILTNRNDALNLELNKLKQQLATKPLLAALPTTSLASSSLATSSTSALSTTALPSSNQKTEPQIKSLGTNIAEIIGLVDAYNRGGDSHGELHKELERYKEKYKENQKIIDIINELLKK